MARPPRSSRAARKQGQTRRRRRSTHSTSLGWIGVRERLWGRWAAKIRVPRTRARLWIGRFELALQAALAYDAALFCLCGDDRLPSPRNFNFPAAPRPDIPEDVRAGLTRANIKDIAESHARTLAVFFGPPHLSPAPAAASPPLAAVAAPDGAAVAGDGAAATTDGSNAINYIV